MIKKLVIIILFFVGMALAYLAGVQSRAPATSYSGTTTPDASSPSREAPIGEKPPQRTSPWQYVEEDDPVTKTKKISAVASLKSTDSMNGEEQISDAVWSCPRVSPYENAPNGLRGLNVQISTFKMQDGKAFPLAQDPRKEVEYRFDGVLDQTRGPHDYSNSIKIELFRYSEPNWKIKYAVPVRANSLPGYMKALYIVDPEFAVHIFSISGSSVILRFYIDDQVIKRVLEYCGATYGKPPMALPPALTP